MLAPFPGHRERARVFPALFRVRCLQVEKWPQKTYIRRNYNTEAHPPAKRGIKVTHTRGPVRNRNGKRAWRALPLQLRDSGIFPNMGSINPPVKYENGIRPLLMLLPR